MKLTLVVFALHSAERSRRGLSIPKRVSGCYVLCPAKWNYSSHLRGLVASGWKVGESLSFSHLLINRHKRPITSHFHSGWSGVFCEGASIVSILNRLGYRTGNSNSSKRRSISVTWVKALFHRFSSSAATSRFSGSVNAE
jgi:hypothetical protein